MTLSHWRALVSIENLPLVVVLVLESKALYFQIVHNRSSGAGVEEKCLPTPPLT